jgi:hypothetical protein
MGFSPKYIRILKSLYDNIFFKVKAGISLTNSIKLTERICQGENCSSHLFILYLEDIETFFKKEGVSGVNVDGYSDISLLLYCDDLVIFADTY